VKRREHCRLRDGGNQTVFDRSRSRDAHRMTVHAAFAKELTGSNNPHHGLFALFG
jgi:hypothetical protein